MKTDRGAVNKLFDDVSWRVPEGQIHTTFRNHIIKQLSVNNRPIWLRVMLRRLPSPADRRLSVCALTMSFHLSFKLALARFAVHHHFNQTTLEANHPAWQATSQTKTVLCLEAL